MFGREITIDITNENIPKERFGEYDNSYAMKTNSVTDKIIPIEKSISGSYVSNEIIYVPNLQINIPNIEEYYLDYMNSINNKC